MNYKLHVVSHTHWDREFYLTFQEFRLRMVDLIDHLIALLEENAQYRHFMLDGQSVLLEDYLEIRPERRGRLTELVRSGRLLVGPWYVQADEYLTSGEAQIRNAQLGLQMARSFGSAMHIGYLPDQFGHISQTPQILTGLGLDSAFLTRGPDVEVLGSEFTWESPDGSRVLVVSTSYANAADLARDVEGALARVAKAKEEASKRARTRHLLFMNGFDHQEPQDALPAVIRLVNAQGGDEMVHSTLPQYIQELRGDLPDLPVKRGELREAGLTDEVALYNVYSSRAYLKQANHRAQQTLERWCEPYTAMAWRLGGQHPTAQVGQAWKYLLQNQAHDSICGCSVDRVHEQMMTRFQWSEEIANALTHRALVTILNQVNMDSVPSDALPIAVFNPSSVARSDTVLAVVDLPIGWRQTGELSLRDDKGRCVPVQLAPSELSEEWKLTEFELASAKKANPAVVTLKAREVPGLGYRVHRLSRGQAPAASSDLRWGASWMENDSLRAEIAPDGRVSLTDIAAGVDYHGLHYFEDAGDVGGGYQYQQPAKDRVLSSQRMPASIELVEAGPVVARFRVRLDWHLPASATADFSSRSDETRRCRVTSYVSLGAGARRLEFRTIVDNQCKDHRMRVCFPTGIEADEVSAESPFDVVQRTIRADGKPWAEEPQLRFVDVSDGQRGMALLNIGLREYEVADDADHTIKLTLFRATNTIHRAWFPEVVTPQAQMLGLHTFEYALYPHLGNWAQGGVLREAESFDVPLRVLESPLRTTGHLPQELSFLSATGQRSLLSIVKKNEQRDTLVVRLYNPHEEDDRVCLSLWGSIKEAHLLDLEEQRLGHLEVSSDGLLSVEVPRKKIVTIELA